MTDSTDAMISRIRIGVDDCLRRASVYEAICGVSPERASETDCAFRFAGTQIELFEHSATGVDEVCVFANDLHSVAQRLASANINHSVTDTIAVDRSEASGVVIRFSSTAPEAIDSRSRLDHVALRVVDLERSTHRWEQILGVAAGRLGIHPVSNGAFEANRLLIGDQMIELVSPVSGVDSAIAQRLTSHGEGVATLAIPSQDLEATRRELSELNVETLWRDPHWFVHPRDSAGVLVQLTPRVNHG